MPQSTQNLFFEHALLPGGWAQNVLVSVEEGFISAVAANADSAGASRVKGAALPGLPNLHSHTFQRAMAGLAERRGPAHDSFWTWREVMYHFLGALGPDDIEAIAAYAFMEMLQGGFTAVAEFHYLHHGIDGTPYQNLAETSQRIANAADQTGIGLTLVPSLYAYANFGQVPPLEGQRRFINDVPRFLKLLERAREAIKNLPDAQIAVGPHSLRAVSPEQLRDVMSACPQGPVHIHAAEQAKEIDYSQAALGRRPVEWLLEHMDINERWCLIHSTHMMPEETKALAKSGAVAGLCPLTEASLGDGIFDGERFIEHGGAFGIGSDSNIEISAYSELKQLEYSQRLKHLSRNVLSTTQGESTGLSLYARALTGGAQALGRKIGKLAAGYRADIVTLDMDHPDIAGVSQNRWLDMAVFVTGKTAIDAVFIGGRPQVSQGRHHAQDKITANYVKTLKKLMN